MAKRKITAKQEGVRGVSGGLSLGKHRRNGRRKKPLLTVKQILAWADAHYKRTGKWPTTTSGTVRAAPAERWSAINSALRSGCRGLSGGLSLARLFAKHRGVWTRHTRPPLTIKQILAWADAYKKGTGKWPNVCSGPVHGTRDETWLVINGALRRGGRGLPGGSSLGRLLVKERGARNQTNVPRLSERTVLQWAKTYHEAVGSWPTGMSEFNPASPDDTWPAIDGALRQGLRGLKGGLTIAKLLRKHGLK